MWGREKEEEKEEEEEEEEEEERKTWLLAPMHVAFQPP